MSSIPEVDRVSLGFLLLQFLSEMSAIENKFMEEITTFPAFNFNVGNQVFTMTTIKEKNPVGIAGQSEK